MARNEAVIYLDYYENMDNVIIITSRASELSNIKTATDTRVKDRLRAVPPSGSTERGNRARKRRPRGEWGGKRRDCSQSRSRRAG